MARISSCPAGHGLQSWIAQAGACDGCHCHVRTGDKVMDCRRCNWYLCETCAPQSPGQETSLWSAFSALMNMDIQVTCKAPGKGNDSVEELVVPDHTPSVCSAHSDAPRAKEPKADEYRDPRHDVRRSLKKDDSANEEEEEEAAEKREPEKKPPAAPMVDLLDLDQPEPAPAAAGAKADSILDLDLNFDAPKNAEPSLMPDLNLLDNTDHTKAEAAFRPVQAARLGA